MEQQLESGTNNKAPVSKSEFFLMFLLLALSGNPFFSQKLPIFISLASIISLYYIFCNYNKTIYVRTLFIFIFFIGYECIHALMFDLDYSETIVKLFLILLFGFTVVNLLKTRFIKVFLFTMYIICIISFVFTVLCYVPGIGKGLYKLAGVMFPLQKDFKNYSTPTLIVYTFLPEFFDGTFKYTRNAGIFWESGAFAVYLNIALYLKYYTTKIKKFSDLFDRQSIVYIMALCTAASTMGILSLIAVLTFYSFQLRSNLKYVGVFLICLVAGLAFTSFDFLGEKISKQLSESGSSNNRFGSAMMDMKDIEKRPLFGWSRRIEVLFNTTVSSSKTHRPNGLTNFLRSYGLIYFITYFYLVYLSFRTIGDYYKSRNAKLALLGILLLWIVSFSELIFDEAFLKSLLFLSLIYKPSNGQKTQIRYAKSRPMRLSNQNMETFLLH
jgi:hypothetical protein